MEKVVLVNQQNENIEANVVRYFKYNQDYFLIFTLGEKDEKNYQKLYIVQVLDELGEKISRNITDDEEWKMIENVVKDSIMQIKNGNDDDIEKLNIYELNSMRVVNPRFFKLDPKLIEILQTDILDDVEKEDSIDSENTLITDPYSRSEGFADINHESDIKQFDNKTFEDTKDDYEISENDVYQEVKLDMGEISSNVVDSSIDQIQNNTTITDLDVNEQGSGLNDDNIDYKKLYFILKEDKKATELLMTDLLKELNLYKKKYGKLPNE